MFWLSTDIQLWIIIKVIHFCFEFKVINSNVPHGTFRGGVVDFEFKMKGRFKFKTKEGCFSLFV
jgi:hypothetical protein